jgi:hypothetical protein
MRFALGLSVALAAAAAATGCRAGAPQEEPSDSGTADDGPTTDERSPQEAAAPLPEASLVGDEGATEPTDCPASTKLIYVASEERQLYSFDPVHVTFQLVGNIDCAQGIYVNSMAVDRQGNGWINYGDGSLWETSLASGGCTATSFVPNQQGVGLFGMGFSTLTPGTATDTLLIDDLSGGGLGMIELASMTLMRFGPFPGSLANRTCELTGTGDGRLFGFFAGSFYDDASAAAVMQLDPNTEEATQQWPLPTIDTGSDWAFAFWGGDFYLFVADKYDESDPYTTVSRFDPSDGTLTMLAQNIGFRVVGAGSSTCAPTSVTQ